MQLKTIGDLKALLALQEGEIRIGNLLIKDAGADIDFKLNGDLAFWLHGNEDDTTLQSATMTISSDIENIKKTSERISSLTEEIEKITEENFETKTILEDTRAELSQERNKNTSELYKNQGMIEAYEKLLAREIHISK